MSSTSTRMHLLLTENEATISITASSSPDASTEGSIKGEKFYELVRMCTGGGQSMPNCSVARYTRA